MGFRVRNCIRCNREFYPNNPNNKYCSIECRFWDKVDKKGEGHCWNWLGALSKKKGYGILKINKKSVKAHILSWLIHFGGLSELAPGSYHGTCVLHTCDNPTCCNPSHLKLGTHSDNMKDMVERNRRRSYVGCGNPSSVLNRKQVKEIKSLVDLGVPSRKIADQFSVGQTTVLRIRNNETYSDVLQAGV